MWDERSVLGSRDGGLGLVCGGEVRLGRLGLRLVLGKEVGLKAGVENGFRCGYRLGRDGLGKKEEGGTMLGGKVWGNGRGRGR